MAIVDLITLLLWSNRVVILDLNALACKRAFKTRKKQTQTSWLVYSSAVRIRNGYRLGDQCGLRGAVAQCTEIRRKKIVLKKICWTQINGSKREMREKELYGKVAYGRSVGTNVVGARLDSSKLCSLRPTQPRSLTLPRSSSASS